MESAPISQEKIFKFIHKAKLASKYCSGSVFSRLLVNEILTFFLLINEISLGRYLGISGGCKERKLVLRSTSSEFSLLSFSKVSNT